MAESIALPMIPGQSLAARSSFKPSGTKNVVGVSAVRDLYGTVLNEGASKGILVTTSWYRPASFDFANGKPLELLDGANLLHLSKEHAGVDARIIFPKSWEEPPSNRQF